MLAPWLFIVSVLLTGSILLAQNTNYHPYYTRHEISDIVKQPTAWDCMNPVSSYLRVKKATAETEMFRVQGDLLVTKKNKSFTAALWSPQADAIVFVSPTDKVRPLAHEDGLSNTEISQSSHEKPIGVSINEIWYYHVPSGVWRLVSDDGANPIFSSDGRKILFISDLNLMALDTSSWSVVTAGHRIEGTPAGLLLSRPLSNGSIFGPSASGYFSLEPVIKSRSGELVLDPSDRIAISPRSEAMSVSYGGLGEIPLVTVLLRANASPISLFRNCPYSAAQVAWAQDGALLAYPVLGEPGEVHFFNIDSGILEAVPLIGHGRASSLSFSPDNEYLAYAQDEAESDNPTIKIVSVKNGFTQSIHEGMTPRWAPDGKSILYVSTDDGLWHLLKLETK
jgi:hypothetical protein